MKICICCNQSKPNEDYYAHPQMADGRLGRCKACHKSEIRKNYLRRLQDPDWREKELDRQRAKSKKHRAEGKKPNSEAVKLGAKKWLENNKHKRKAHYAVSNALRDNRLTKKPCEKCGDQDSQAHHDDYSKPLNVRWLCTKHHNEHHVEMRRLERFARSLERQRDAYAETLRGIHDSGMCGNVVFIRHPELSEEKP